MLNKLHDVIRHSQHCLIYLLPSVADPDPQDLNVFMYRRPTLCTLHIAVDFLKSLKIAVVVGGGCYWDIVHILYPCR